MSMGGGSANWFVVGGFVGCDRGHVGGGGDQAPPAPPYAGR